MASCTSGTPTGTGLSEPVGLPEKERTKERGIKEIQKKKKIDLNDYCCVGHTVQSLIAKNGKEK